MMFFGLRAAVFPVAGCTLNYTDANGAQHVVGLVDVVIQPTNSINIAGSIVDTRSFGLSFVEYDGQSGIGVGYQHITTARFLDNSLAIGPFDRAQPVLADGNNGEQ